MLARLLVLLLLAPAAHAAGLGDCAAWFVEIGEPETRADGDQMVLCRTGYLVSYHTGHRTPSWVLEVLTSDRFVKNVTRSNRPFVPDPDVKQAGKTAVTGDYTGSGFDRGHMSPAADNTWLEEAMAESFYLSNIAPQHGPSMNRGIWAQLEDRVRDWAVSRERIIVISGPVFGTKPRRIGDNKVAVPDGFFKIVYDPAAQRALAFYFDNKPYPRAKLDGSFLVTVSEVEEKTGLKLFSALDQRTRKRVKSTKGALWR